MIDPSVANTLLIVAALVLLPIVPAVLIYKMLPDQRVFASGSFAGMQLKATGAVGFYAFVLVVAVGVQKFAAGMELGEFETWTINGNVRLADSTDSVPTAGMSVAVFPPSHEVLAAGSGAAFRLLAPVMKNQIDGTVIQVSVPRYIPANLALAFKSKRDSASMRSYRVTRDPVHRVLTIEDTLVLNKQAAPYTAGAAINSSPTPAASNRHQ